MSAQGPNQRGLGVYVSGGGSHGREIVQETITCAHCNQVKPKPKPGEPYGFCGKCYQPTCLSHKCNAGCAPFEKKIEKYEARMRFRAAV